MSDQRDLTMRTTGLGREGVRAMVWGFLGGFDTWRCGMEVKDREGLSIVYYYTASAYCE